MSMPLRLYYFTTQQYGIEALLKQRLKLSRITSLNDPFELLGLQLKSKSQRKIWNNTRRELSELHGLVCMSDKWSNPVLWSHYADNHKGICLGFDVNEDLFKPVSYRNTRISFDEIGISSLDQLTEKHLEQILYAKFEHWEYESEYRAFTDLKELDPNSGLGFISFSSDLVLKEVIVGANGSLKPTELNVLLSAYGHSVETRKARLAFNKFEVTEQKKLNIWNQSE